ncbi:MAG: lamin tail domain-containing protein [candidate division Zixibacteria bacterium]|nr:lamin tail domain-containing protein [candidate division Zixibacteria bacterium]
MSTVFRYSIRVGMLISLAGTLDGAIVINELMINEPASEVALEWVELFNNGDAVANLADYIFVEASDTTSFPDSLLIPVGGFALLSPRPVALSGEVSFESTWGNNSGVWGDHPDENYLLLEAEFSLKNTGDSIKLIHLPTNTSETVLWSTLPPDGVSLERINPFKSHNPENFDYCRDVSGSTPGEVNSLIPPDFNLGFVENAVILSLPMESEPLRLAGQVKNYGLETSEPATLIIYFDRDFSGNLSGADDADTAMIAPLMPDSLFHFECTYQEPDGRKSLRLELSADDDSSDNYFNFHFALGEMFTELRITEFLINPTDSLDCEWVELVNVVDYALEVEDFSIGDLARTNVFNTKLEVEPAERILVCEDMENFINYYGLPQCQLLQPVGWNNFHNTGDIIVVTNDFGKLSDTVRFIGCWPENTSWERDEDSPGSAFADLFYRSTDSLGSTPCAPNSIRPLPLEDDLGFPNDGINIITPSGDDQPVRFEIRLVNYGAFTSAAVELEIYFDADYDWVVAASELYDWQTIAQIPPADSVLLTVDYSFSRGYYQVICLLPADQNNANNRIAAAFSLGPLTSEIIITEFLADPQDNLECEWLECRNLSSRIINLSGWSVGDSLHQYRFDDSPMIAPGEYFIITQDTLCFVDFYGSACFVVQPSGWSYLNNSGDRIMLLDSCGTVSDSVTYTASNGDNRSLELNEYEPGGDEGQPRNWYASTDVSGSTPCQSNSVSGETADEIEVTLLNKVFAPNLGEELRYRLRLPPATLLSLEVFDLAGRKHYTIADAQVLSSGEYGYGGESDYRGKLPVGAYVLKVTAGGGANFTRTLGFAVAGTK